MVEDGISDSFAAFSSPQHPCGGGQPPVLGKAQLTRHPVDLLSLSIRTGNDWFELAWQKSQLFIVAMVIFSFKLSWQ